MRLPWGLRWWEMLPEALLGLGLGVFLITETSAATSAFRSTTAVMLMTLTAVGWLVARVLLVRYTAWPALRASVFGIAALGVLVVVVLPAYDDTTVIETLGAVAAPTTTTGPPPGSPNTTAGPIGQEETSAPTASPAPATTSPTAGPAAIDPTPQPVALRTSPIHGIDHRASGTAVLYRQPDGSHVVGLEGIDIQPGPDYDVYVVAGAGRESIDGGTRLDDLRGNKGTQYYPVPAGVDVATGAWTVLVWCETFDVPVAGATPV